MSDKIVVPGGMLDAALEVARERRGYPHLASLETARLKANVQAELEAALRWIAKNPIGPTNEQAKELWRTSTAGETNEARRASLAAVEWQRRMFLAPEPEVQNEICAKCGGRILRTPDGTWYHGRSAVGYFDHEASPEPEVPEEIKDLILPNIKSGFFKPEVVNERMAECYRRGQKAGPKA